MDWTKETKLKYLTATVLALVLCLPLAGQDKGPCATSPYRVDSLHLGRARTVVALETGIAITASTGLYFLWYNGYDQSRFHLLNDNYGWLQMDKYGHAATNYQIMTFCYNMNRWSGLDKKKALIIGASVSFGFQAAVEVFDGFSEAWGASLGDLGFNTLGLVTFVAQEMAWNEQRIAWKFSFRNGDYGGYDQVVEQRARALYGQYIYESFLKDYNGQTYWLSSNISAWAGSSAPVWLPKWLNLAVGYGAEGMLGANWNVWYDKNGCYHNYEHIPRYRQYFISLDIDWDRIPTRRRWLKAVAPYLNIIKFPFPALEYNRFDGVRLHALYF
jgi:hypothetical protein